MKVSIRVKLVLLLVVVGLLPLLAAVVIIVVGGRQFRSEAIGQSIQMVATSEANIVRTALTKDIEKLHLGFNEEVIQSQLAKIDKALPPTEIERMDANWRTLPRTDARMQAALDSPLAAELRRFTREDPRLSEVLVTDRYGQLVAATGLTDDYYQADEEWWLGAENGGNPRVFIPEAGYDTSSKVWSIDLCIPIMADGKLLGVGKAVLDVSQWMQGSGLSIGPTEAALMVVRGDGTILFREGTTPLTNKVPGWQGAIAETSAQGWRVTQDGQVQGFASIRMPRKIGSIDAQLPDWTLVVFVPRDAALQSVTQLSVIALGVGLGVIAVVFLVGLYLVDHFVVRRIYRLHGAATLVAEGDLSHHIEPRRIRWRPVAIDEIDDLSMAFNRMVEQIKRGYEELAAANQLKTKFIRIAGHELRTPVSYILGVVKLLKDSHDADRLLQAVQTMGSKAKRLDEIIQAMFKLMPDQRYSEDLRYSEIKVSELMEEVYLDCFPFVEQRKQQFIIEGGDRIDTIHADREKLRDVLENLVLNAIKFTPDGGVVKLRIGHQLGNFGTFAVQDQGPGIPEADMPHIFEPFYTGGDVMKHSTGTAGFEKRGMGLGLTIVRHFTELHGGSVSVSTGPSGSIFTVTVPLEPPIHKHGEHAPPPDQLVPETNK